MRKLPAFAFGGIALAALAGAAVAAAPKTHKMDVPLPDGSVAHIEYVGDVAPKVTVAPSKRTENASLWGVPFPAFAGFDRMFEQMQKQRQQMMQQMSHQGPGKAPYVASYGSAPAGETSTTVVSVSNNGVSCIRTTEVVSQGPGKPLKVTRNATGQCGAEAPPPSGTTHPV